MLAKRDSLTEYYIKILKIRAKTFDGSVHAKQHMIIFFMKPNRHVENSTDRFKKPVRQSSPILQDSSDGL